MYPATTSISALQSKPTEDVKKAAKRLLNYACAYPNNKTVHHQYEMVMFKHTDFSHDSQLFARGKFGVIAYMGKKGAPEIFNGPIEVLSSKMDVVVASAAEGELGSVFVGAQHGVVIGCISADLGYPQHPIFILCDNKTAVSIANETCKNEKSKSIDMRFFWVIE